MVSAVSSTTLTSTPSGSRVPSSCSTTALGSSSSLRLKSSSSRLLWMILPSTSARLPPDVSVIFPRPLPSHRPLYALSRSHDARAQYPAAPAPAQRAPSYPELFSAVRGRVQPVEELHCAPY